MNEDDLLVAMLALYVEAVDAGDAESSYWIKSTLVCLAMKLGTEFAEKYSTMVLAGRGLI